MPYSINCSQTRIFPIQILLTINVNTRLQSQELSTKPMVMILNFQLGTAIDINRKLVTINAKLMGTILNLFIKTGNDYSHSKHTESLYRQIQFRYLMLQIKVLGQVGRQLGRLIYSQVGRQVVGWQVGMLVGWQVGRLIGWQVGRLKCVGV